MHWIVLLCGLALVTLAAVDLLWTTLTIDGGGPLTARLSKAVGRAAGRVARWPGGGGLRTKIGTLVIVCTLAMWIALTWTGWALVFNAHPDAVHRPQGVPWPGLVDRIYFTGFTIATLGIGDLAPGRGVWQLLAILASLNGFALLTLSVTYLIPIVSGAVEERAFALRVAHLGGSPSALVTQAWDGRRLAGLEEELRALAPRLETLAQKHAAYPVLYLFESAKAATSIAVAVAVLDETVELLDHGIDAEIAPPASLRRGLRRAVQAYTGSLRAAGIRPADEAPPPPRLDTGGLTSDLPRRPPEALERAVRRRDAQRRLMRGVVNAHGFDWEDVQHPGAAEEQGRALRDAAEGAG